jgi:class 3 adenylate cyclase
LVVDDPHITRHPSTAASPAPADPVSALARVSASVRAAEVSASASVWAYKVAFETIPRFRAGLHSGPVIVSECGGFKRQLAYFGDTMNVSARLCEHCKVCGCNLIVSGEVLSHVAIPQNLQISVGRNIALRGRNSLLEVLKSDKLPTTRF